jgi:integrase/recombinase XerD
MELIVPDVTSVRVEKEGGLAYWVPLVGTGMEPDRDVAEFMQHLALSGRAEKTTKSYVGWLAPAVRYRAANNWTWSEFAEHMDEFLVWRRQLRRKSHGRGSAGPSTQTMRLMVTAINELFRFLISSRRVSDPARVQALLFDPVSDPELTRAGGRARYRKVKGTPAADLDLQRKRESPKAVSLTEFHAMMEAASSVRDAFILMLLGGAALRVGAVASLQRNSIHQNTECEHASFGPHIHVVAAANHPHGEAVKYTSVVPAAMDVVQWYWAWLEERTEIPGASTQPWLLLTFPSPGRPGGEPLSSGAIRKMVDRVAKAAGIRRKITPHMLRHFVGQSAADLGLPPDELQRIMGHRSIQSQAVYRNVSDDAARRGAELLAEHRGEL